LLDTGALKTTEEKAEVPSLDKEGWLRPLKKTNHPGLDVSPCRAHVSRRASKGTVPFT